MARMIKAVSSRSESQFKRQREQNEQKCNEYVELEADMYCITICAHFSSGKYSPIELHNLFLKCLMVFSLQILIVSFFYHELHKENLNF